jgi:uncharacterized protein (DUF2249 family)
MNDLELDLRPVLRNGGEPFGAIMEAVGQLAKGQRLRLYATFKPEPLFQVMAGRGFANAASRLADGDWMVIFTPRAGAPIDMVESDAEAPQTWPDPAYYLDCTGLAAPEPMVRILSRLETTSEGEVLFALLDREPVFLYPELKALGHAWVGDHDETGEAYRLMIRAERRS